MKRIYVYALLTLALFVGILYGETALLNLHSDLALAGAGLLAFGGAPLMVAMVSMLLVEVSKLKSGSGETK